MTLVLKEGFAGWRQWFVIVIILYSSKACNVLDDIENNSWWVKLNWAQNWPGASRSGRANSGIFSLSTGMTSTNQEWEALTNLALLIILLKKDINSYHFPCLGLKRGQWYDQLQEWKIQGEKVTQKSSKQISVNDIFEPNLWHHQSWALVLPSLFPWSGCSLPKTGGLLTLPPPSRPPAWKWSDFIQTKEC